MQVRTFRQGDDLELHQVFCSAVHVLAARDYSPEQLEVWAPSHPDMYQWGQRMRSLQPLVAEESGLILGYADVQPDGYIDHFYVSGPHVGRGVGRLLMGRIHERAHELELLRLFSNVSHTARPFFAHFGFQAVGSRLVTLAAVSLGNTRMEKSLRGDVGHHR